MFRLASSLSWMLICIVQVVSFLDYHDLYAFNFSRSIPADQPRDPIDTREAIRLIRLKLRVTKVEPPGEDDGQDLPVVTFRGTSYSLHSSWDPNANSKIRGMLQRHSVNATRESNSPRLTRLDRADCHNRNGTTNTRRRDSLDDVVDFPWVRLRIFPKILAVVSSQLHNTFRFIDCLCKHSKHCLGCSSSSDMV